MCKKIKLKWRVFSLLKYLNTTCLQLLTIALSRTSQFEEQQLLCGQTVAKMLLPYSHC